MEFGVISCITFDIVLSVYDSRSPIDIYIELKARHQSNEWILKFHD